MVYKIRYLHNEKENNIKIKAIVQRIIGIFIIFEFKYHKIKHAVDNSDVDMYLSQPLLRVYDSCRKLLHFL